MGGAESEISDGTQDVVLECAYFAPKGIRRTARRQGMHTESSHRFERGTDHGMTEFVLDRARQLLCALANGKAAPGVVRDDGEAPALPSIELRSQRIDRMLGVVVPFKEAIRTLTRLGFSIEYLRDTDGDAGEAVIKGASHRPDVNIEPDLIDEVARIRGLDAIPTVLPAIAPQAPRQAGELEKDVAAISVSLGLSEALTYSFVSPSELEALSAPEPVVVLDNPLTEERSVLRTSLLPGLLEALRRARRRGQAQVQLFAMGSIFLPVDAEIPISEARPRQEEDQGFLPAELPCWSALLAGPRPAHLEVNPQPFDVYDAKALALHLVERLTRRRGEVRLLVGEEAPRHLHPRGAAGVFVDGGCVGTFGPLHPDVVERLDLGGTCQVVEMNLGNLEAVGKVTPRYRPIPKLPAITRDMSLVVSDATPARSVASAIQSAAGELCESVEICAEFRGGSVPKGQRSLTFRVVYRDPAARLRPDQARTLTDKEVDSVEKRVLERTARDFGAELRLS
jgi:phenylalanyl-tRNA synthetase beta chain